MKALALDRARSRVVKQERANRAARRAIARESRRTTRRRGKRPERPPQHVLLPREQGPRALLHRPQGRRRPPGHVLLHVHPGGPRKLTGREKKVRKRDSPFFSFRPSAPNRPIRIARCHPAQRPVSACPGSLCVCITALALRFSVKRRPALGGAPHTVCARRGKGSP